MSNLLIEQGWLYLHHSNDIAIEVLYPEYDTTYTDPDGNENTNTHYSGSNTISSNPFTYICSMEFDSVHNGHTVSSTLNTEQLSFGRTKGTIIYINAKFVTEIKYLENGNRVIVTDLVEGGEFVSGNRFVDIPY